MRDSNQLNSGIDLVCQDCGKEALAQPINQGKKQFLVSTWYNGICDVCHKMKPVTEARDWQFPTFP